LQVNARNRPAFNSFDTAERWNRCRRPPMT